MNTIDPFAGLNQNNTDPFEGLAKSDSAASASSSKTPFLGALAKTPVNEIKHPGVIGNVAQDIKDQIDNAGTDENIRLASATEALQKDPVVSVINKSGAAMTDAGQAVLGKIAADKQEYALEEQALDKIHQLAVTGSPEQAQVVLTNMQRGGPEKYLTDINTKQLILQRELEKAGVAEKGQSWIADAAYFFAGFLPLEASTAEVGNADLPAAGPRAWYDSLITGNRVMNESSALFRLPAAEFSRYVRENLIPNIQNSATFAGLTDKGRELQVLSDLYSPQEPTSKSVWNTLDNVGLVSVTASLAKTLKVPMLLLKNGAREAAVNTVADAAINTTSLGTEAVAKRAGVTANDVVDNLLPSAVNPNPTGATVPLSTDVGMVMSGAKQLLDNLPDLVSPGRLTNSETTEAITAFTKKIQKNLGDFVKDVKKTEYKGATGQITPQLEITLGKKSGGGYARKSDASRYLSSLGYKVDVIQDQSGQYFGKLKLTIPETGFYTSPLSPRVSGPVDAYLRSGRNLSDPVLADMAHMSGDLRNAVKTKLINPILERLTSLNGKDKASLGQILSKGRAEQKWYNNDELTALYKRELNRLPTQKELDAYQAARDVNDIEFLLRNEDEWSTKARNGYQSASFNIGNYEVSRENAIVDFDTHSPEHRTYDVESGHHYKERISDEEMDRLRGEGRVLVKTERTIELPDGTKIDSFLVNRGNVKVEDLKHDQVPYNPGGHTIYTGRYFPKQAKYFTQPDEEKKILANPSVYGAFDTKVQADWWVDQMETARRIYSEGADNFVQRLEEGTSLGKHASLPTVEEFIEGFKKGLWDKDTPFESCVDREMPSVYNRVDADSLKFVNKEEGGLSGYMRSSGQLYYGRRGEQLPDFMGRPAQTLDPYETLNQSLANVSRLSSFSDYKETAINRWVETYKDYIKDYAPNVSPAKTFMNGALNDASGPKMSRIRRAAETQRKIIQRTLGWRTPGDRIGESVGMKIAGYVAGGDPNNVLRTKAAVLTEDWWSNRSPLNIIRGFAFNTKLGFFNPAQFVLQAFGAMNTVVAAGPRLGTRAVWSVIPTRMFLLKGGSDDLLEEFIRKGIHKKMGFDDPKEFKVYMNTIKNSGFFDFNTTHLLINSTGPDASYSSLGGRLAKATEASRFFFNEGEIWNRVAAARVAWDEVAEKAGSLSHKSPEFIRQWSGRAEDWALQMSETSQASWQHGIASIPTQFWAYNARMAEALLGKTFTPAQRIRMAIAQFGFAGAAGTPISYELAHQIWGKDPESEDLSGATGTFKRGLIDSLIYNTTGADVQLGERVGTGNFLSDTIRDIFGYSAYGEKSAADVFGGASYGIATSFFGSLGDVAKWAVAESGGDSGTPITWDPVVKLASNVSTLSNLGKAYMIFKYHTLVSSSGHVLASDVPTVQGFAQALGFSSGEALRAADMQSYLKDRKKMVNDLTTQIVNLRTKAFVTDQKVDDYLPQINLLMKMYPEDVRVKAISKAQRETPDTLYDSIATQYETSRAKAMAVNNEGDK